VVFPAEYLRDEQAAVRTRARTVRRSAGKTTAPT